MKGLKSMIRKVEDESHGLPSSRVHGFLEISMILTGRGEVGDDYIKAITFPLGNITIYSDPYYNMITVYSEDDVEMDLEDDDEVNRLADELKKRILSFDRRTRSKIKEATEKTFDEPVDFISFDDTE